MNKQYKRKKEFSSRDVANRITPEMDSENYRDLVADYKYEASLIEGKAIDQYMQDVNSGHSENIKHLDAYLTNSEIRKRDKLLKKADVYTILAERAPFKTVKERNNAEREADHEAWVVAMERGSLNQVVSKEHTMHLKEGNMGRRRYISYGIIFPFVFGAILLMIGFLMFFPSVTGMTIGGLSKLPVNITVLSFIFIGIFSLAIFRKRLYPLTKKTKK